MPGRSLTTVEDKARKRAAMIAARARAQARATPDAITEAELMTAREIMREVAAGSNVHAACFRRELPDYAYWDWIARAPVLLPEHELALRNRALAYGEQPVAISDEPAMIYEDKHGVRRIDPAFVQYQKLRINTRQWDAERLQAGRYAPTSASDSRGPVAVHVTVQRFVVGPDDAKDVGQTPSDVGQNYAEGERVAR